MQQFGVKVQRKRHPSKERFHQAAETSGAGLEVAGVALSRVAVVIAHFHGSEYFGLFRLHLAANNRVVLR